MAGLYDACCNKESAGSIFSSTTKISEAIKTENKKDTVPQKTEEISYTSYIIWIIIFFVITYLRK
jgi:hypothetical protein